jgi:hypothetical protein
MVYIVNYQPEELKALFDQPLFVEIAWPEPEELRSFLKLKQWQSLINDQTAAEYLSLLLNMRIPVAENPNRKVNFKYSDEIIVFLLKQVEEEVGSKKIIVPYYKLVYVHMIPASEFTI